MSRAAVDVPEILATLPIGQPVNGWFIPSATMGVYGTDYSLRAYVARNGLTANTPEEAVYLQAVLDGADQPLNGTKQYTMTFKQPPSFNEPAFRALRMFDATNYYPVPNPINRYVLGSDYPDMKKNADGSLTIYLQSKNPGKDKEANWLPTPTGPFMLILGTYAPGKALIDGTYVPPPAVIVK